MSKYIILSAILAVALAANCGTYKTSCYKGAFSGSSKGTAYVTCGFSGFVSHIDVKLNSYGAKDCSGDSNSILKYLYNTKTKEGNENKMNAKYVALLKEVSIKSNNVAEFTKNLKCTPEMKNGKTYDINDISCKDGIIGAIDVFAVYRLGIGKETDMEIKFEDKKMSIFGGVYSGTYDKTSGFWGCIQGWSLTLIILLVIIIILAIVIPLVVMKNKKSKKCLPKKK